MTRAKLEPFAEHNALSKPGSRIGYVMAECPKHGTTAHLEYLDGRCCKCAHEALVEKGLVRP